MGKHHKHHKRGKGLLSLLITAFVLQLIWNAVVPDLFNGPYLGYMQALLIILVKRLLTGGMGMGMGCYAGNYKGSYDWDKQEWKDWKEKWGSCSTEDWKNHFEQKWNEMEQQYDEHGGEAAAAAEAEAEAKRDRDEVEKGFKKDGKFDVNVVDVEDNPSEEDEASGEDPSSDEDDK